jgi:hypothetical protein
MSKIRNMNAICREMTDRIQSNKEKTQELLKKTAVLQTEKKELNAKQTYLDEFFGKYSLNEEEERILQMAITAGNQGNNLINHQRINWEKITNFILAATGLNDAFFKVFNRLLEVSKNTTERIALEPENLALSVERVCFIRVLCSKFQARNVSIIGRKARSCLWGFVFIGSKLVECQYSAYK